MKFIKRGLAVLLVLMLLVLPPQAVSAENTDLPVTTDQLLPMTTAPSAEADTPAETQVLSGTEGVGQNGSNNLSGYETVFVSDMQTENSTPMENTVPDSEPAPDSNADTSDQDTPEAAPAPSEAVPADQGESLPENTMAGKSAPELPNTENIHVRGWDNDISWAIYKDGKLLVIGSGDFTDTASSDSKPWKRYANEITSAEVNLTGMTDASNMFGGCYNLTEVNLQNFDTSTVTNMESMFGGCNSLQSLDLSNFNTANVTNMAGMFGNCNALETLDLSNFNTSNVTNMEGMFTGCNSLQSLDLSNFDTSKVTSMSNMFDGCCLQSLDLSGFDTSNVTTMERMFYKCSLKDLNLSGFNAPNLTNMKSMFQACHNLKTLNLSGFNAPNLTNMEEMFADCRSLESLNLNGFSAPNVTNMKVMFSDCKALETLDLSSFNTSNITDMSAMFIRCNSLQSLNLDGFDTSNVTKMDNTFKDCNALQTLNLSSFNTSKVTDMREMFSGCNKLQSLDLSNFNTSNVTDMSGMFSTCFRLQSLDLSSFNTSNVTDMADMFSICNDLQNIVLNSFDTSNVTNMFGMFYACHSLQNIDLSNFNASKVTNASVIFSSCSALTTLQTPYNLHTAITLPAVRGTVWRLPDGTEVTELSEISDQSITVTRYSTETPPATTPPATTPPATVPPAPEIITTTDDLNMPSVIRVKYVPYSCTLQTSNTDESNIVTFSLESGRLADGLKLYPATGEIYGMPLEAGQFPITVKASYSNPAYQPSYADLMLIVLENTNENIADASDPGYELTQSVPDLDIASLTGGGSHLLISNGEYSEFLDVYLDGQKLAVQADYTAESGSTRITILNQTLARNGAGSHTLSVEFRTQDTNVLRRAAQNYTVSQTDNSDSEQPGNDSGNDTPGGNNPSNEPGNNPGNGNSGNGAGNGSENNNAGGSTGSHDSSDNENTESSAAIVHYVKPYDTLWSIAVKYYGSGIYWRKIFADNADRIRNPNIIYTGQPILIYPLGENSVTGSSANANSASGGSQRTYSVQPGDNLWRISARVLGSWRYWDAIYQLNQNIIRDPRRLYPGQILVLPETPVIL